ncbi:RING finger protein 148-like [Halichoeres trimaculatus]|uniref:RING finger protein 148-like n=1 Tax=Halichoeres trimaculatus TaxID=147232 RepID=UPI003D9DD528
MGKMAQLCLLLLLCLSRPISCFAFYTFWTAVVDISYTTSNNQTVDKNCECGVFGDDSPLEKASGIITLPEGDPKGCGPDPVYNRNASSPPWIALVKRGNCTFSEKINAAKRQGAAGVLVYNLDGSGNETSEMDHPDAPDIVAVMIGNFLGMELVKLVKNGTEVQMLINVGRHHGPWIDSHLLNLLAITLFLVVVATISFSVVYGRRLVELSKYRRAERRLKDEAKKAIKRLQVRTLRQEDEETTNDSNMCAVCIESYRPGEVVTVLTCDHIFHKTCIEPWLLEKRTCPMCKCDILKALGVEEEPEDNIPTNSPPDVTVVTVTGEEPLYEVPLTDPGSFDPQRHQHLYDNRAFEGESEPSRG